MRLFAVVVLVLLTLATSASADPGLAPPTPGIIAIPVASPPRLLFANVREAANKMLTVNIVSPVEGDVEAILADQDFRVVEIHALSRAVMRVGEVAPVNAKAAAPFKLHVLAGTEVQISVVFAPKTIAAVARAATLAITGPGPSSTTWTQKVPLTGNFVPGVQVSVEPHISVVQPATFAALKLTFFGTDHDVVGKLHLYDGPTNVVFPDINLTIHANVTEKVVLPLTLVDFWGGNQWNRPGGYLKLSFTYENVPKRDILSYLDVYPQSFQIASKQVSHKGCDDENAEGFVIVYGDGHFDLQFNWDATSWKPDSSTAMLFTVMWKGKPQAQGIFPKSQGSAVYFRGMSTRIFKLTYSPIDYIAMFGGGDYTFTCKVVPASTHF